MFWIELGWVRLDFINIFILSLGRVEFDLVKLSIQVNQPNPHYQSFKIIFF